MARPGIKVTSYLLIMTLVLIVLPLSPMERSLTGAEEVMHPRGTIIVNASGSGDYTHIQWAIDNASDGDTVYVEAGTYYENIEINKTISLIGAGRDNTIIIGIEKSDVIRISVDRVIISGFHIKNSDSEYNCILILFSADNCRIENVTVSNSYMGILLGGSNNNTLIDNIVRDNRHGIYLDYAENNSIVHNTCSENTYGINVVFSERNVIDKNILKNNYNGIAIDSSANNTVSNNTASFNKWSGITLNIFSASVMSDWKYFYYKTRYNQIIENFCESNNDSGIEVWSSDYNNISHNTCIFNSEAGISVSSSDYCIVEKNNFISNAYGIYFSYSISSTIRNNICLSNQAFGIILNTSCENNTVHGNDLLQNNFGKDQGADNGTNNSWNLSHFGNYWSDWTSPDSDNDLIVDIPYDIFGSANSTDFFPLVEPANQLLPIADAGPDIIINQDNSFILNGTSSWGYPSIINYTWSFTYNNSNILLYGPQTGYYFHQPGTYRILLTVITSKGSRDTDEKIVYVRDTEPPLADAGPDLIIEMGESYLFDGKACRDNAGITNYTWSFTYNNSNVFLYGMKHFFIFHIPGKYLITINVSDAWNNWDKDQMILTVIDPLSPVGFAGDDITIDQHDTALFNGSSSNDNVGINNYTWSFTYREEDMYIYGINNYFQFDDAGIYAVVLNVTDGAGNWATDTLNVTVLDTTPPTVYAGEDIIINQSETVEFFFHQESYDNVGCWNWTWSFEYNGQIQMVYRSITMSVPHLLPIPWFTFDIPGNYSVTMTVYDEADNWATDRLNITVLDLSPPIEPEIDTDNDTYNDTYELSLGSDPNNSLSTPLDIDADGWNNTVEVQVGTDPDDSNSIPRDTDEDGIPDSLDPDRDGDGVANVDDAYPDDGDRWKKEEVVEERSSNVWWIVGVVVAVSVLGVIAGVVWPDGERVRVKRR